MATVVKDIVDGTSVGEGGRGRTATRVFHVTGVTGSPTTKAVVALRHREVAQLGEVHPEYPELYCTDRSVNFMDSENARVTAQYAIPSFERGDLPPGSTGDVAVPPDDETGGAVDLGTISVSAAGSTFETDLDIFGKQMVCAHDIQVRGGLSTTDEFGKRIVPLVTKRVEQVQRAQISRPSVVLRVSRMEKGSPDGKARLYVGTVNSKPIGFDPARSWLCTRIDGTSNDGGETYKVSYEFQYNRDLWIFIGIWIDPQTEKPVESKNFNTDEEFKVFQVYEAVDFAPLGIKFEGTVGGVRPLEPLSKRSKAVAERGGSVDIEFTVESDELFK
jgi:hypothetical protein